MSYLTRGVMQLICIQEKTVSGDNKAHKRHAISRTVLNWFADPPRLLQNMRNFATPCSRTQYAVRVRRTWEVPQGTKFPVAFYDKWKKLRVAQSEAELKAFLKKIPGVRQVLLFEVPPTARFVWVEFAWGERPRMTNVNPKRPIKLDQFMLDRVERARGLLFADVPLFRLGFSVTCHGKFELMEGVVVGYR